MPKILTIRERGVVRVGDVRHVFGKEYREVVLTDGTLFRWEGNCIFLRGESRPFDCWRRSGQSGRGRNYYVLRYADGRAYEIGISRQNCSISVNVLLDGLPIENFESFCEQFDNSLEANLCAEGETSGGRSVVRDQGVYWKLKSSPLVGEVVALISEVEMANSVNPHSLGMRLCASNSIDSSHETSGLSGFAEPRSYREAVMKPYRDGLIRSMAVEHPSFPKAQFFPQTQVAQDGSALTDASDYARAVRLDPKTAGKEQVLERIKLLYQERERYARASGLDPQSATDDDIIGRIAMLRNEPDQLRADVVKKLEAETAERQRLQHMVERLLVEKNGYATMIRDLEFSTRRILREIDSKK